MELTERKKQILKIVVDSYVATAEPVGSKAIVELMPEKVSSATVRNELADLTEMGYLEQPHTSAGRIPSARGYRLYVNELMERKALSAEEMENEITARRTPMPEIIDLLAKNENAVVRQIFSGVRRRMRERSGLSLSYLWCAGMRAAQADAGLGREECGVLCDAANFLGRYDVSEQKAAIDTALRRLQMLRELAFAELRDRGSLYRTCGIAAGLLVILVLV